MHLLDTDIMVDILRGYLPAIRWLNSLGEEELVLPGFVVMELMEGCEDKRTMQRLQKRIASYRVHWPPERDSNRALGTFAQGWLSHHLDILDTLIGECVVGLGVPLCTFNVRYFRAVAGLTTDQPYERV